MPLEVILLKKPYEVSLSGNPMPFSFAISPYGETEKTQDIRLQVRILVETLYGSGIYNEVKSQNFYPTGDGMIELDVHSLVDPYLEYYTPKPTLQRAVPCTNQRKRYKLTYILQKDNAIVGTVNETPVLYAIKGGMAYEQWHSSEFFTSVIVNDKKPLQFIVKGEKAYMDEKRWLYWVYPYADNAAQQIKFEITLNNGIGVVFLIDADNSFIIDANGDFITVGNENILHHDISTTISGSKWSVFCMPIGFNQINLQSLIPAGLYAISYTVQVITATATIVSPVTFTLDYRTFYNTYDVFYRNSVGGLETIRMRGQVDMEADYGRQQAQRTVPPSYYQNLILLPTVTQQNDEVYKCKADTGFLSKEATNKLRDLFLSPQVLEWYAGRFVPVNINSKNAKFYSNRDSLISTQVEWQRAFSNEYFTPDGLMPSARTCPALEQLSVKQLNKTTLQIMYALAMPYDRCEVQVIIGGTTYTYTYTGNSRVVKQGFVNPATTGPTDITIKGRTVCDEDSIPVEYGAFTTVTVSVIGNSLPVVNDDNYNLAAGHNSPITLAGSVLANDYDPDGDAIEVVAASGTTNGGGTYSINAAGMVTYQPASSSYSGQDYFDYQVREVGGTTTVTGRVYINVGAGASNVYAKIVYRNSYGYSSAYDSASGGEAWVDFFSDAAATLPLDVTGFGLTVNIQAVDRNTDRDGNTTANTINSTVSPTGFTVKVYEGEFYSSSYDPSLGNFPLEHSYTISIQPGTGYTVI